MTALDELMGEFSSFSLMSYDHNAGPKLWSRKASARALQPWRGEVEMGESRTPFGSFRGVRRSLQVLNSWGSARLGVRRRSYTFVGVGVMAGVRW